LGSLARSSSHLLADRSAACHRVGGSQNASPTCSPSKRRRPPRWPLFQSALLQVPAHAPVATSCHSRSTRRRILPIPLHLQMQPGTVRQPMASPTTHGLLRSMETARCFPFKRASHAAAGASALASPPALPGFAPPWSRCGQAPLPRSRACQGAAPSTELPT